MDFLDKAVWLLAAAAVLFAVALLIHSYRAARSDAGRAPAPPPPVPVPVPIPERFAHAHHHAYAYIGSGRYQCEICGAMSASFADARDQVIGMDQSIDDVRERTRQQQQGGISQQDRRQ